jgi:hypothetical protein
MENSVSGAQGDNGDDARMISALSHKFRKLDGVSVTDTQPALNITCVVIQNTYHLADDARKKPAGTQPQLRLQPLTVISLLTLFRRPAPPGAVVVDQLTQKARWGVHSLTRI